MQDHPLLHIVMAWQSLGVGAFYFFGPRAWKPHASVVLGGMAVISCVSRIQTGHNPLLWYGLGLLAAYLITPDLKKILWGPNGRLPRRERRALAQLFESQWWRKFTDDPRLITDCTTTLKDPVYP